MMRITDTVKQLIIINVIFFICSQIIGEPAHEFLSMHFPENPAFKFWQPLTHIFMHADISHIFFNMLLLWMFGSVLEEIWGTQKFIFFYLSCGLGAIALSVGIDYYMFNDGVSILTDNGYSRAGILDLLSQNKIDTRWDEVLGQLKTQNMLSAYYGSGLGASGAIYGILVAFAFMFPEQEMRLLFLPIPIKAKYFVSGLLAMDFFLGIRGQAILGAGDGIGHFAHLGGALIGLIMMWYWKKNQFNNKRWD